MCLLETYSHKRTNMRQVKDCIPKPSWSEHPDLVEFYMQQRNRPEDLYPSERRFLPWLAARTTNVLDVGCAAAGFKHIWRYYQSNIAYTGADVSASLIAAARALHPDSEFYQANCAASLPLPDNAATIVQALGWLHWEPQYREALRELWRLTGRYLFFDVRLARDPNANLSAEQQLALTGSWDGKTTTPYLVVAWLSFAEFLMGLHPMMLLGYGYLGETAGSVKRLEQQICFATFVLEKHADEQEVGPPTVCVDMPMTFPTALATQVNLLPATHLDIIMESS